MSKSSKSNLDIRMISKGIGIGLTLAGKQKALPEMYDGNDGRKWHRKICHESRDAIDRGREIAMNRRGFMPALEMI